MYRWQPLSPASQFRLIVELPAFLFFPRQPYFTADRPGILAVFIPGEPFVNEKAEFPDSWSELFTSHYDFSKGERTVHNLSAFVKSGKEPPSLSFLFGKAVYDGDSLERLLRWLVERYNVLAFHQTDPTEFMDDHDLVDFVACFEHALTLDRAFRKGLSCAVSLEAINRNNAAMEIADVVSELSKYWRSEVDSSKHFKRLVHPHHGLAILKAAFSTAPPPFASILVEVSNAFYESLRSEVIKSVFVTSKRTDSAIFVRDKKNSKEIPESYDDFTANVVRALRNTHHGYLTKNDKQLRPSRYLALVDGTIPEAFSRLGLLLSLATAIDPETLIGWKFKPLAAFD